MANKQTNTTGQVDVALKDELREPQRVKVVLLNDDYTSMEFVVRVLIEVFHKNLPEATKIMYAVHEQGKGICGIYPIEIAETKVTVVHAMARAEDFPLRCSLEPV